MEAIHEGYLVWSNGRFKYGTKQHHENGQVSVDGVRGDITPDTPSFCGSAEAAAEYLRFLAKTKYEIIGKLAREADTCQGNAVHLERTIAGK
jgi:hypothetical protein